MGHRTPIPLLCRDEACDTGIGDLAFYKHFESKDQLVAEATAAAMETVIEEMAAKQTANGAMDVYLSTAHRDNAGSGCPLAGNGDELSRADSKTREAATNGFRRLVDVLAGEGTTVDSRRKVLVAAVTMIGAMTMSRVVTDAKLSDEILREARKSMKAE